MIVRKGWRRGCGFARVSTVVILVIVGAVGYFAFVNSDEFAHSNFSLRKQVGVPAPISPAPAAAPAPARPPASATRRPAGGTPTRPPAAGGDRGESIPSAPAPVVASPPAANPTPDPGAPVSDAI